MFILGHYQNNKMTTFAWCKRGTSVHVYWHYSNLVLLSPALYRWACWTLDKIKNFIDENVYLIWLFMLKHDYQCRINDEMWLEMQLNTTSQILECKCCVTLEHIWVPVLLAIGQYCCVLDQYPRIKRYWYNKNILVVSNIPVSGTWKYILSMSFYTCWLQYFFLEWENLQFTCKLY